MSKQSNIPKLRFKGFNDRWTSNSLSNIADKNTKWSLTGGPFGSDLKSSDYTSKGVRVIQLQNMGDGLFLDENKIYTSIEKADSLISCNIYPGDIILSKMGDPVARACIIPESNYRYLMCSDGIRLSVDTENYSKYFIFISINNIKFRNEALIKSTGSTRKRIGLKELKELQIYSPTLPEQEKIASFLSAVDEKIQQLTRKAALLAQYKKGVMQKLFSGKLRFKDENGEEYADWEEKKLGDVCDKIQDGNYGASYPKADEFIQKGIPFLTSKALGNDGNIISNKIDYISIEKHKELKKAHLKLNDILFTNRGANVGAIGIVDESISHGNIGPQLTLLRANKDIIDCLFLFQVMNSYKVKKQISSQDSGSAMNFFGIGETSKFTIPIPSLPEQQKIAGFLSGIDEKIFVVQGELLKMQGFKKGLLQQMFV